MVQDFTKEYEDDDNFNQMKHIAHDLINLCKGREDALVTEVIEVVLPHLQEDDFLLRKNFTIV